MTDHVIIELFLKRDEKAIAETEKQYGSKLHRLAEAILLDEEEAKECVNDTLFATWNAIPPSEPYDYFYTFLARIARITAFKRCRDNKRLKRSAELVELSDEMAQILPDGANTEDQVAAKLLLDSIAAFLKAQKLEKRQMFMRRYWYSDSELSIAEKFGVSKEKVKVTLFRMRKDLKNYLEREGFKIEE